MVNHFTVTTPRAINRVVGKVGDTAVGVLSVVALGNWLGCPEWCSGTWLFLQCDKKVFVVLNCGSEDEAGILPHQGLWTGK